MTEPRTNEMETRSVPRLLVSYSIPAIMGMIITSVNQIISSIYIGYGVGHVGLAAMAITFPVVSLVVAFSQLVAVGCAALCSIELGRKNQARANSMLGHAVVLELSLGVIVGLVFWVFLNSMLVFFGASETTLGPAREFMLPTLVSTPITFLMMGLNFFARASGYPKTAMFTAVMSSLGIVLMSPVFIFWLGWDMFGAGMAQVAGQLMSVTWLLIHFFRRSTLIHFRRGIWRIRAKTVTRIMAVGTPPFLINFCACIIVIIMNRALSTYGGDLAIGAFGIVNRLIMLFSMSVVGLGQGMQPIIGYNFGAKHPKRVRLALGYGIMAGAMVTGVGMLGFWLAPGVLVRMFTDHAPLIETATHALRLLGMLFAFAGPQIIIGIYFQSVGQPKIASVISLFRQMLFLVPALLVFPRFLGLDGVWMSIPFADFVGCVAASAILIFSLRSPGNPCGRTIFARK